MSFVLGPRVFFLETFYQVIRRLILDGDIKGGCKGEEST